MLFFVLECAVARKEASNEDSRDAYCYDCIAFSFFNL